MPAEARIAKTWKNQKLIVALVFILGSVPFWWDGAVGYHRKNERYKLWKGFADAGQEGAWRAEAARRGWKQNEWSEHVHEHHLQGHLPELAFPPNKITEQYVCASIALAIGGAILAYWLTQIRGVLKTDEEAVYTPAGTRVPFGAITGVGKKKWDSKGIAKVRYELDGRRGEFVVDDYKFEAEPARKILAEIEEKLVPQTPQA
jgi:hypothetical protein